MSFEKILYKLRDAWRGDIKRSLEGLPGYYWGEVTAPGEVLLDAVAPGSAPVPVDDLVGALVGDRVLLVLVDGAFSVVGVAGRGAPVSAGWVEDQIQLNGVPRFATVAARNTAFPAPVDGQVCYVTGDGYYVRDGGVWTRVFSDTVTIPLVSPFQSVICEVTRDVQAGLATITFRGSDGTPDGGAQPSIGNIPAGYRPASLSKFLVGSSSANNANSRLMAVDDTGDIHVIASGALWGASSTGGSGLRGAHTYRLSP